MLFVLAFIAGGLLGISVVRFMLSRNVHGTLRIDNSDGEGPYLFVELNSDVPTITKESYVTFKVKVENYISHQ